MKNGTLKTSKMRWNYKEDIRKLVAPKVTILDTQTVWSDNRFVSISTQKIQVGDFIKIWTMIEAFDSVCIALKNVETNKFLMLSQFRLAAQKSLLEFVAGKVDDGETPKQAAIREAKEETGFTLKNIELLYSGYSDASFCKNKTFFLYGELKSYEGMNHSEGESINLMWKTLDQLNKQVENKTIQSNLTMIMIGLLTAFKK